MTVPFEYSGSQTGCLLICYLVDFFPLPFPRCRQPEHFHADLSSCKNISAPVRATHLKWYQLLQQSQPMLFSLYWSGSSLHSSLQIGHKKRFSDTVFSACVLFAPVSFLSLKAVTLLRRACFFFLGIAVLNECNPSMMEIRRKCSATSSYSSTRTGNRVNTSSFGYLRFRQGESKACGWLQTQQ